MIIYPFTPAELIGVQAMINGLALVDQRSSVDRTDRQGGKIDTAPCDGAVSNVALDI